MIDWMDLSAQQCYRDLAAGQLPIDDHHAVDWLATHPPSFFTQGDEEDLDDMLEVFCRKVKEEETKAKTIAEAAT